MNYQAICAALETPLNNAFAALSPPVKIYFDNLVAMPPDPPGEYAMINITFGLTSESSFDEILDRARGAIIARIYTKKGNGGRRARLLAETISCTLKNFNLGRKSTAGIFVRVSDISGPTFFMDNEEPYFIARISASWSATDLG